jgi:hypothetical protein
MGDLPLVMVIELRESLLPRIPAGSACKMLRKLEQEQVSRTVSAMEKTTPEAGETKRANIHRKLTDRASFVLFHSQRL